MQDYNKDYIVILVCDNIPNQKFWNDSIQDWTTSFEDATVYETYGDSGRCIWNNIPGEKVTARITSSNKTLYYLMLSGKWDGRGNLPDGY
jgi:hypothetical protein